MGDYQAIRSVDLNGLNDENSRMRHELRALRVQLRQNTLGSSDMSGLTATQVADRMMRARSRAAMDPASAVIPVNLRGLAVDTEERLMVGGPMDGRIVQFRADTDHYQARETQGLDIRDIRDAASRSMTTRTTLHTYLLFRRDNDIPMMIVQDLLNSPRSVQNAHVDRAMRIAGIGV